MNSRQEGEQTESQEDMKSCNFNNSDVLDNRSENSFEESDYEPQLPPTVIKWYKIPESTTEDEKTMKAESN